MHTTGFLNKHYVNIYLMFLIYTDGNRIFTVEGAYMGQFFEDGHAKEAFDACSGERTSDKLTNLVASELVSHWSDPEKRGQLWFNIKMKDVDGIPKRVIKVLNGEDGEFFKLGVFGLRGNGSFNCSLYVMSCGDKTLVMGRHDISDEVSNSLADAGLKYVSLANKDTTPEIINSLVYGAMRDDSNKRWDGEDRNYERYMQSIIQAFTLTAYVPESLLDDEGCFRVGTKLGYFVCELVGNPNISAYADETLHAITADMAETKERVPKLNKISLNPAKMKS